MRITYNQCVDYSRKASKNRILDVALDDVEEDVSVEDVERELMNIKLEALSKILKK